MPRRCGICTHPQRREIAALIALGGYSLRSLAKSFDVSYDTLKRHVRGNHDEAGSAPSVASGASQQALPTTATAVETFEAIFGMTPMPHQVEYLTETRDLLALKGRQVGMTQAAAALAVHVARSKDSAVALIISPSKDQSKEVNVRARHGLITLGESLKQDTTSLLRLDNGSRIISLPGKSSSVRGYSADLVILDEAAWVQDPTWVAAQPLVAATGGRLVVQSTPGHPIGFFYDLAMSTPEDWARMEVPSEQAQTVSPDFLERRRKELSPTDYAQEYACQFAAPDAFASWFTEEEFDKRVDDRVKAIDVPSLGG